MRKRGKNPEITDGGMWALPTGESLNNILGSRLDGEETASYIRWILTERGADKGAREWKTWRRRCCRKRKWKYNREEKISYLVSFKHFFPSARQNAIPRAFKRKKQINNFIIGVHAMEIVLTDVYALKLVWIARKLWENCSSIKLINILVYH